MMQEWWLANRQVGGGGGRSEKENGKREDRCITESERENNVSSASHWHEAQR